MVSDELRTLLESREWVTRRVDRVEFLDLTTVRRTIDLSVHASRLNELLPRRCGRARRGDAHVPLGWFLPWANARAALLDSTGRRIPYLTSHESDELVARMVVRRLGRLGIGEPHLLELVGKVPLHRRDPAARGRDCACREMGDPGNRLVELIVERWGCRVVLELLEAVHARWRGCPRDRTRRQARELAMVLLAWQTNFVLFAPLRALSADGERATLRLSFDEELREWGTPLGRAKLAEGDGFELTPAQRRFLRRRISRGGPFTNELNRLLPRRFPNVVRAMLARSRSSHLQKLGRRGLLRLTWHVAWHQASGLNTPDQAHQVDVILPDELMAVRVRMLRKRDSAIVANVADQVGSRATIVAPEADCARAAGQRPPPPPPPTLFSLSIAQRSTASWISGAWIAALTGAAVMATAWGWLPTSDSASTDAITTLIVAPTLVAALLSVRARSEFAEQLTATLRLLIGAVGVLAAICALGILAHRTGRPPALGSAGLKWLWVGCSALMLAIAASLGFGAARIRKFIAVGRRPAPRAVPAKDIEEERALNPRDAPRISPPDLWLDADEGEVVPWGWLDAWPYEPHGFASFADDRFWGEEPNRELVEWVQDLFCYTPSQTA